VTGRGRGAARGRMHGRRLALRNCARGSLPEQAAWAGARGLVGRGGAWGGLREQAEEGQSMLPWRSSPPPPSRPCPPTTATFSFLRPRLALRTVREADTARHRLNF
jgi:hypothetical protein